MPVATPPIITKPFAADAGPGQRNDIPVPSQVPTDPGLASFTTGFPPATMTPIVAGGVPPYGQDMNGILYMISSHIAFIQAGQCYKFDADVVTAIGGYAVGTLLQRADGTGFWMNTAVNNLTNPDGGAPVGWVPAFNYGYSAITGLTNANRTLTPLEAAKSVIILSGILTGNVQIIFPKTLQTWLIVNNCSGAFSITAKTVDGGGVLIPQGGPNAPVGVWGDGVALFPTVAPVALPIDVAPTPDTIAKRSNVGYLYATYFNQSSGLEGPTVGAVFVQNTAADGFLRKISLTALQNQMPLLNFAGQVTPAQVPLGAVLQYAAQILSSPAMTGIPTAPTASAGTNTTQVATTAFVNAPIGGVLDNQSVQFPGGLILKYGYITGGANAIAVAFNTPFPTAGRAAFCCTNRTVGGGSGLNHAYNLTAGGCVYVFDARTGVGSGFGGWWFAIGN